MFTKVTRRNIKERTGAQRKGVIGTKEIWKESCNSWR